MAAGKKNEEREAYLALNQDLRAGSFRPVYLLYGSEEYLKSSYKRLFREAFGGADGMNYSFFEGAAEPEALISVLETMPFFAENRLVVLSGSGYCKKSAPERLCEYLPGMPEGSHLLMIEQEVDKRNRLYKLCTQLGVVCELGEQDEKMLSGWAAKYLGRAGKKIRGSSMELLLAKCGKSMENLAGELEKLIAYAGEREVIGEEDIELICTQNVEDRVFDMISELSLGNRGKAMQYYSDLLTLQEAPMRVLALMRRNFNQLLLIKECMMKGKSRQDSAKYAGVSPWVAQKLMDRARHYTIEGLEHYLRRCLDYDEAIKNGNLSDRMAVELLITA